MQPMDISILLPTRQRPAQLVRLIESVAQTVSDPGGVELVTYIDDDDASYDALLAGNSHQLPDIAWTAVRGARETDGVVNISQMWNHCYHRAAGPIFMLCGDDIVFRTVGWDRVVRAAFTATPDRIQYVFGDDGYNGSTFGTHGFVHRNWVDTVGYFVPPYFVADYIDTFLNDVARLIGRHHPIPILTEHMHFIFGKADKDANTQERLARAAQHNPGALYASPWFQDQIKLAAQRLRHYISEHA